MANSTLLNLVKVNKRFNDLEILKGIDFQLEKGETVSIAGPSGAGKSTLLHIAGLMDRPTDGVVSIGGQDTRNLSESERARCRLDSVGFLFQFHYLLPDFDALENVLIPARLAKEDLNSKKADALEILDRLGLSERIHHRPSQLSGGEQQRVALARALVRKPKMLLCDEPTGNLDSHTADKVMSLIWTEIKSNDMAGIVVTHNEKIAQQAKTRYQLVDGQFVK